MLSNMPNPYASPQADLAPSLTTDVTEKQPPLESAIARGAQFCIKAIVLLLTSVGVMIAAVLLRMELLAIVVFVMIVTAAICHIKGLVHLHQADANRATSSLFAVSLIAFIVALCLNIWLYYVLLILREQTSRATGWVQQFFLFLSYISLLWGLIRIGKSQNQPGAVLYARTSMIALTIVIAISIVFPNFIAQQRGAMPLHMGQSSLAFGILVLVASIVGLASYVLALWFIRKAGIKANWQSDMLYQLKLLHQQAKAPDETAE